MLGDPCSVETPIDEHRILVLDEASAPYLQRCFGRCFYTNKDMKSQAGRMPC